MAHKSTPASDSRRVPTIEDVARLAGVSTATVSRSLNATGRVREATRKAVESAVRELGYTPNFGGQALALNRTNTVGAIIPTMENAIFARAIQALQETLAAQKVTLLVATSQYLPEREEEQIRALLARGVDGVVLIGNRRASSAYALLNARGVPFVLLWSAPDSSPFVTIGFDNSAAAIDVTTRILKKGHRRIGMISGLTAHNDRADDRVRGVSKALTDNGLELAPQDLVECRYSLAEGEAAAMQLLQRQPRPTAIICGNDVLAAGALRAARALGLVVPGDLSVVGFDDIELATAVFPPLATVRVPHRRMGVAAGEYLLRWIVDGKRPPSLTLPTEFIERASLGNLCDEAAD
ncbi:LacI family DNA-binding transcriptional regulator [Paracoccus seriniphilus]|uniref:Transcriptional regulator, LacI family n=1 Tax=Paracoccus seriniphilus TaxID=184748 RepID=A0A239PU97_9RHOB|nr:LacI family DNA-binding transcriptional regulator [Paracoccus seriniphilus]WCR16408.1 LacI family DNA-binding transcriptional regulator [Paracoccus seriniphilus]SNT73492.1 transcriptional regulator, LacI family [Paracoccus seriniphilus]